MSPLRSRRDLMLIYRLPSMAGVAKWLRHWIVVPAFGGSSPLVCPILSGNPCETRDFLTDYSPTPNFTPTFSSEVVARGKDCLGLFSYSFVAAPNCVVLRKFYRAVNLGRRTIASLGNSCRIQGHKTQKTAL